ncbi:helix-turn-helix domain-containing protein [Streptomyces sp. KAU_LT]|uniref:helix-turn-helix domain-containing protein n=1 Tax=Streptomyces sp. KAU_LT TaxID=3046669 RepID=UPI0024B6FE30|nr:helix-turn-helix domain-containing protein [Streptomyces sp. KAU_LT]MDI9836221.1 helix-turn-helix domain-containing protein [Streptomyces sp. KAU_LT]
MSSNTPEPRAKWQAVKGENRDRMRQQAAKDYRDGSSIRAVAAHLSEMWGPVSFGLTRALLLEARVPLRSKGARTRR